MSASESEPIAVVGMGCRFPGRVASASELWRLAASGRSTVGPVPPDRWDADRLAAWHDPDLRASAARGCFVEGDLWAWEPEALAVAPAERDWVDPQTRLMMEVAWEAVEHAGIPVTRLRGSRTGVYVGTYANDNLFRDARPVQDAPNSAYLFGNFTAGAAGRVAFAMDLRGPVMVVSTHCSSGLVALDSACGALTLGECDLALAGGVLLMIAPQTHYYEAPLLLSPTGACHAFDARADGYVRGEGAGALLLKRYADARRDGDRVLAVIRGSAVNNDGQSTRLTAPSTEMQQELFRVAVGRAGVDPGTVGLVEAHGPGTAVGDPVEYTSIHAVYGRGTGRCALGSVKTNIGHSEPVSGIAGIIKTVECLRRGSVPPNQHFERWNPGIDRAEPSRLFVPTRLTPWPVEQGPRTAAVCSYGVSGTNAHVVLEQAPDRSGDRRPARQAPAPAGPAAPDGSGAPLLHVLSANSPESLARSAARLADWLFGEGRDADPRDVAHTLAVRRQHADHRLGLVATGTAGLRDLAAAFAREREDAEPPDAELPDAGPADGDVSEVPDHAVVTGTPVLPPDHPGPVFVFTGQGSQYPGMCRELLSQEPVFAGAIEELEPLVRAEAGFSLREAIEGPAGLTGVDRIQPVLFAVQVGLAALWRSWGVRPTAVIGQSLGEVAASVVAGALTPADGARVICRRAGLLARVASGAMASVMFGADRTRAALDEAGADGVSVAVVTAPGSTVVSGDADQVRSLVRDWEEHGVPARMIDVDVASHSAQVDPILDDLHTALGGLAPRRPELRLYSTVADDPRRPGPLDAGYWARNQRRTVHFQRAVEAALADGHRLFVECTAHPLTTRAILQTAAPAGHTDVVAIGSLRRRVPDREALLGHVAALHTAGDGEVDLGSRYGDGEVVDVPVTAWHRTRHGGERAPYTLVDSALPAAAVHPLLGGQVHDPDHPGRRLWQTPVGPDRVPWLGDHRVAGVPVLPGTAYADMLLAAAAEAAGTDQVAVADVRIEAPLVLDPEPLVTTRLTAAADGSDGWGGSDGWDAEVVSTGEGGRVVHARGRVRRAPAGDRPAPVPPERLSPEGWRDVEPSSVHQVFRDRHDVVHGPAFTALDRILVDPDGGRAVATLRLHETARVSAWTMPLHPALADQVVQTAVSAWLAHHVLVPGPVVVTGFDRLRVHGTAAHTRRAVVELLDADEFGCSARALLTGADGTVLAEIDGLRVRNVTPPDRMYADRLSHQSELDAPAPADRARDGGGSWLLLTSGGPAWAEPLAGLLDAETAGCRSLPLDRVSDRPELLDDATGLVLAVDAAAPPDSDAPDADAANAAREAVGAAAGLLRLLADRTDPPRLWLLTPSAAHAGTDSGAGTSARLTAAALTGLLRSAAYELPQLRPSVLTLDPRDGAILDRAVAELLDTEQPITELRLTERDRRLTRVVPGAGPEPEPGPAPEPGPEPAPVPTPMSVPGPRTGPNRPPDPQPAPGTSRPGDPDPERGQGTGPVPEPGDPSGPEHPPGDRRSAGPEGADEIGGAGHPVVAGGSYLVTGGLGGLGLRTADWLAAHGAGRVVLLGRSAPDPAVREHLAAAGADGTDITVLTGDIADPDDLRRALDAARAGGRRLRGVVHAAGVVEDATLGTLDAALLDRVWRGKAAGAWALHRATLTPAPDFFVLYSSVAALVGSPGQGAYAAANAFLDGLAAHRRALGLPATSIQWGAWREVGRGQHLAERGLLTIRPDDGVDALERVLTAGHTRIAYSPLDWDLWTRPYPEVRASTLLAGVLSGADGADDSAPARRRLTDCADPAERRALMERLIIDSVRELLGGTTRHIGRHTSMVALGLDSLGAVQLQQHLRRDLGTELKPGVIWVKPSPATLADWLLDHMGLNAPGADRDQEGGNGTETP
ncbi:type I polyketide synthase [Streptomyces lichenis]|uniref:SDR family NAD(P)-dependent oxidoreductase n=1 Tax=Streptomyces lichenis TaxID=2306967 RepID=A0ABT0IAS6_9ACTN|nr:type I polyketide synthase [Streptomyces lichenis]MCK8678421.1 SDR family NAD(P)-dependent oxidoreductase [Streptomyces lichenis]